MNLTLKRTILTNQSTIGELSVNGKFECYTLEDVVRSEKIYGKTAIPAGRYQVIVNMSNRFKRKLPLLLNVENYEGVRIHPGNDAADTHGCPLVGQKYGNNILYNSKLAFEPLMEKIEKAFNAGETIHITIE